jgi:hypothetical protein
MDIIVRMGNVPNARILEEPNKKVQVASMIVSKHVQKERNHLVKNNVINVIMENTDLQLGKRAKCAHMVKLQEH